MTILNKKGTLAVSAQRIPNAVSYNGNPQYTKADAQQLYELIVMSLYGKDSFYESNDNRVKRLETLVNNVVAEGNLHFIANAIVHARHVMNIRSMPLVLAVYFAKALRDQNKTYPHLRAVICDVIGRADQITDMYAVALGVFGSKKAIPMAVKRGVADAFNKFNEYQFGKYNGAGAVKLRDVLRIVHPKPQTEEQGTLFEKIMKDTLTTPYTWETQLSQNGQAAEGERKTKAQVWTDLITSGKVGYMALLRNLRNIIEAGVSDEVQDLVATRLSDPKQVAKSKQLPFRFVNALDAIEDLGKNKIVRAISRAVDLSLGNIPSIGNHIWIIIDCSSSMNGHGFGFGSSKPNTGPVPIKTASLFAAAIAKANAEAADVRVTLFSDRANHISVNTDDSVLSMTKSIMDKVYGGGTALESALALKPALGFEPDTVIVLSDMQVDQLSHKNVAALFKKDCVKIAINLEAYGSTPLDTKTGWIQFGGWSERLFDFLPSMHSKEGIVEVFSTFYKGVAGVKAQQVEAEEESV